MSDSPQRVDALVDHLEHLVAHEDRATLARLRASLSPARALDGLDVVLPFVTRDPRRRRRAEDDALLLAGLFALHPESGDRSLPSALAEIARTSDSVEMRFRALLSADREDLPNHLRHAVALAASKKLPIDWRDLHAAIRFWDDDGERARRRWARDFWTYETTESSDDTTTP